MRGGRGQPRPGGRGGFAGWLDQMARRISVARYPLHGARGRPALRVQLAAAPLRICLTLAPTGTSAGASADEGGRAGAIAPREALCRESGS